MMKPDGYPTQEIIPFNDKSILLRTFDSRCTIRTAQTHDTAAAEIIFEDNTYKAIDGKVFLRVRSDGTIYGCYRGNDDVLYTQHVVGRATTSPGPMYGARILFA